jgi:hypothetical protein
MLECLGLDCIDPVTFEKGVFVMSGMTKGTESSMASAMTEKIDALHKIWLHHPFRDTRRWTNTVHLPTNLDENLFGQLYSDCFTHHNDVRYAPKDKQQFHFQDDPRRLVRKNNLTAFFQNKFLDSNSEEYKRAPIYQNENATETEDELGEPATFQYFYRCVTNIPFDPDDKESPTLGENRITFLIGDVGMGKTFLISQVAQRIMSIEKDINEFKVIPVYACLETFIASHENVNDASEFARLFLLHFFDLVKRSAQQFCPSAFLEIRSKEISKDSTSESIGSSLSEYLRLLARSSTIPTRVVAFIDNLDVLHYQNSRYTFFPHEYTKHRKAIEDKLIKLIFAFVDPNVLGDCGLCCCITARQNVARESRLINQPALPRRQELESHSVFQLGRIDPIDVVKSRLAMFELVLNAYVGSGRSSHNNLAFADQLSLLKVSTGTSLSPENFSDGLRRISDLSHHGARSLVDFLNKLRLNLLRQQDVVARLFGHHSWLLERLYIANMHQRYSQSQGHFPNLFLIDGRVNEVVIPDVAHRHTYWLKYLILRRVGISAQAGVSVQDLLDEFSVQYGFEESIVRLCLGSLAMVNESRCIEIIGAAKDECHENLVRATNRGRLLIGADKRYRFPYCFEFSYLQMVIDDHLLSLPRSLSSRIAVESSLHYAMESGDKYPPRMRADLSVKLPATLSFVRLLEAAWTDECRHRPKLAAVAPTIGPDFECIYENILLTVQAVAKQASLSVEPTADHIRELREDRSYDAFFRDYADAYSSLLATIELSTCHDTR